MRFLNSKERKEFFAKLKKEYEYEGTTDFVVAEGAKGKYYFITRDIEKIPFEEMRLAQGGLYVAREMIDGLRLNLDGAILLAKDCKKEKVKLTDEQKDSWMMGDNIFYKGDQKGFLIVQWGKDILGVGKVKEKVLLNFMPRERRILDPHE